MGRTDGPRPTVLVGVRRCVGIFDIAMAALRRLFYHKRVPIITQVGFSRRESLLIVNRSQRGVRRATDRLPETRDLPKLVNSSDRERQSAAICLPRAEGCCDGRGALAAFAGVPGMHPGRRVRGSPPRGDRGVFGRTDPRGARRGKPRSATSTPTS